MKQSGKGVLGTTLSICSIVLLGGLCMVSRAQEADPVFKRLYIQGDSVNVRANADIKSAALKKASTGENCEIVERGKAETIGGKQDYWYRIELYDVKAAKSGWVFGAFTSLKQEGRKRQTMIFDGCRADSNNFSHKIFRDSGGRKWDFSGTGNDFGDYQLCDAAEDKDGNPTEVGKKDYLGKSFEVIMNNLTFRPACMWEPAECSKLKAETRPSILYLRLVK